MKTPLPTAERIRLTISVTPEVHAAFERLAKAGNFSIGRAMGDWLHDTLSTVEWTAAKMEEARKAPALVMREMHAYALGLADETGAVLTRAARKGPGLGATEGAPRPGSRPSPPPSNTGGKVPKTNAKGQK
jgi:hypothetical protein